MKRDLNEFNSISNPVMVLNTPGLSQEAIKRGGLSNKTG